MNTHTFWALKQVIRLTPGLMVGLLMLTVIEGLAPVMLIIVTKNLVDVTISGFGQGLGAISRIVPWIMAFFLISLLTFEVMHRIRSPIMMRMRQKMNAELGGERLKLVTSLSLELMEQSDTNDLLKRSDNPGDKIGNLLHHMQWMLQNAIQIISISMFFSTLSPWIPPLLILTQVPALILFSVIETAKENGLIPCNYLEYLFEQLPQLTEPLNADVLEPFLPWSDSLPADCRMNKI